MKIGFALLHYNNIMVTKTAVQYLQELNCHEQIQIIIVDNCSPNRSGETLTKLYKDSNNVHVILNTENIGFAKGNNIGYLYAKNIGCDAIVVMNSDIFIRNIDFCENLKQILQKDVGDIIAPRIMTEKGDQNPFRTVRLSSKKVVNLLMYNIFLNMIYKIPGLNLMVSRLLDCRKIRYINSSTYESEGKIWAPHGSCIIYTNSWIRKEDVAFLPCTFMYIEEDILAEYIHRNNYKIYYAHNLAVYHAEDASINSFTRTSLEKRKFISKYMVQSLIELIKMRVKYNLCT